MAKFGHTFCSPDNPTVNRLFPNFTYAWKFFVPNTLMFASQKWQRILC
jgi:hypothetical protein